MTDSDRQDHDQRLKVLLVEFFEAFCYLFLPKFAKLLDFTKIEWLQNEAFPDPPQGAKRVIDLLAKIPLLEPVEIEPGVNAEELIALVHTEVEAADSLTRLRRNMFHYYAHLEAKYPYPILPVALLLRVGLEGLGTDHFRRYFADFKVVEYNYYYIGLPGLQASDYLHHENILGAALSVLMRIPEQERARYAADALQRVATSSENEYRRFLLGELVEAYAELNEEQQAEFETLIQSPTYEEVQAMGVTTYEKGVEQGIEQGIEQGQRKLVLKLLEKNLGPASEEIRKRVELWPVERLPELNHRISRANSVDEIDWDPESDPGAN